MPGTLPPPSPTPLVALPGISLDLETTGLDVRHDRIVQIGIVALTGDKILDTPRLDQLIDPGVSIPAKATAIMGLGDADVADAPTFIAYIDTLRDAIAGRVVIGHHIAFDLAVIRYEAARAGIPWIDPPALDIGHLMSALQPTLPDFSLEAITAHLGVTIKNRHSALGDSLAVAEAFARLLPLLRQADVRTLGEARSLAAERQDFQLREAAAGWHAVPGDAPEKPTSQAAARIDSYVFSHHLRDVMSAPPLFISGATPLADAAREMIERRIGALLVGEIDAPPEGIITERDLLRAAADDRLCDGSVTVSAMMTSPVAGLEGEEMLYRGLARMDRMGIRHLCVFDHHGLAVGMVSQRDLLHHRAREEMIIDDGLDEAADVTDLALAFSRIPQAAEGLVSEGLGGVDVARVVSRELRAVTGRAADLAIGQLESAGRGGPPAPWCLFVLGSGGRGESLLSADQDNGLIHEGSEADDGWFTEFGARVADFLDEAGLPRCTGGVMAANATWRGTQAVWRDRIENWVQRARPEDLLNVDIFFDLRPVAGDYKIGNRLHEEAVVGATQSRPFLNLMAQSVEQVAPRFRMFGRPVITDGRRNLKRDGLLPLVSLARSMALRAGSTARATPERIADAVNAKMIGERDGAALIKTHAQLLTLILRQQLTDLHHGVRPGSGVAPKLLSREERKSLDGNLKNLESIVGDVRSIMSR